MSDTDKDLPWWVQRKQPGPRLRVLHDLGVHAAGECALNSPDTAFHPATFGPRRPEGCARYTSYCRVTAHGWYVQEFVNRERTLRRSQTRLAVKEHRANGVVDSVQATDQHRRAAAWSS